LFSVTLYLLVIAVSDAVSNFYAMRAVYLAIAGYLIGLSDSSARSSRRGCANWRAGPSAI
jgi:hypothetical protein